jgi:tetratricopeptide (TPR) repeat protein
MSYREEERSRLRRQATRQAIELAVQGSWREAIAVNRSILDAFPQDVEALNRLGRAHLELGEYAQAEAAYSKTAEIDPYNAIAAKNLSRLEHLREADATGEAANGLEPQSFIEEVGKAGVVRLVDVAAPEVVARTAAGDRVKLTVDGPSLIAETAQGEYLGRVDGGHSQRLIWLMEGGNRYSAAIVSASGDAVSIIIREVYQAADLAGRQSFPSRGLAEARLDSREGDIRREREQEDPPESGYTVVGAGEEAEVLVEGPSGADDGSEEE